MVAPAPTASDGSLPEAKAPNTSPKHHSNDRETVRSATGGAQHVALLTKHFCEDGAYQPLQPRRYPTIVSFVFPTTVFFVTDLL